MGYYFVCLFSRFFAFLTGSKRFEVVLNIYDSSSMNHYVFGWYSRFHKAAGFGGITIGNSVFANSELYYDSRMIHFIRHEHWHTMQQKKEGLVFFVKYVWFMIAGLIKYRNYHKAYQNVPYEIDANLMETYDSYVKK